MGVDFVIDYGASDLRRNIECCDERGKVVIVDLHGRDRSRIDLALLEEKRAEIKAFDLQSRDLEDKASVIAEVRTHFWPAVLKEKVVPHVEYRFPVTGARKALNLLKKKDGIGKIILCMSSPNLKMD
ncbi:uncharacterized protein [Henckelia pumila]|uniref:uncharacterized protein n=1 Tax=Henckelia pumila TaxID=405737 RepID=UPI003C6DFFD6